MSHPATRRALLVFGRDPVPGRVKTRLIPALGEAAAADVYRRLLNHALGVAANLPDVSRTLWLDRPDPGPWLRETAAGRGFGLAVQCAGDLGQRMHQALDAALAQSDQAVLIGSDCPEYGVGYLELAFRALQDHDAVLGPAADGGYVLVGLRRPAAGLFAGIDWSTGRVLEQTRSRLRALGLRWSELATLHDVDTPEDLQRLRMFTYPAADPGRPGSEGAGPGC